MARNTETLKYFPKNLQDKELYKFFSTIMDEGLNKFFDPDVEYVEHLFKPHLSGFDPDNLIRMLGGKTIIEVMSERDGIDMSGLAQMMPDFIALKGTMEGFLTALKLAGVQYRYLKLLKTRAGCTKIIVVVENTQEIISRDKLVILMRLAEEVLPVCVKLSSITNCLNLKSNWDLGDYSDWSIELGLGALSQNWRLDRSVFGRPTGGYVTDKNGLLALFCRKQEFLFNKPLEPVVSQTATRIKSSHNTFYKNYADKFYGSDYNVGKSVVVGTEVVIDATGYNNKYNSNYQKMFVDNGYLSSDYTNEYELVSNQLKAYSDGYALGYYQNYSDDSYSSGYNYNYNSNYVAIRESKPIYGGKGNLEIHPIQTSIKLDSYDYASKLKVKHFQTAIRINSECLNLETGTYLSIEVPTELPKTGVYTLFDYEPEEYET